MILESVDRTFFHAILEAVVSLQGRWKLPEDVWEAFREWSARNGRGAPGSLEGARVLYHQVQDLYEFAVSSCSDLGEEEVLRRCGNSFAQRILKERLTDILTAALAAREDTISALGALFQRFMHNYAPYIFRSTTTRAESLLALNVSFSDPQGVKEYLTSFGKLPAVCFRWSLLMMEGTIRGCLEVLLEEWNPGQLSCDPDGGYMEVHLSPRTRFNFPRLVRSLADYAQEVQRRHSSELVDREMESDLMLQSAALRAKWHRIRVAAASDELILLQGEPGTGKTHLARRMHELSRRKSGPFVEVGLTSDLGSDNLLQSDLFGHVKGAFTSAFENKQGLFALAHGGTIFLDEIGDAGPDLQARLLRVIESKVFKPLGSNRDQSVDVRIITATNRDLNQLVQDGKFRADLFHRINVISIDLPPLRERRADLPILFGHFLRRLSVEQGRPEKPMSHEVESVLLSHSWPGNFRELIHVLKHSVLFSDGNVIECRDLPSYVVKTRPAKASKGMAPAAGPAAEGEGEAVQLPGILAALRRMDWSASVPLQTETQPWHIDYARKIYLVALIRHFKGNLRKVTRCWDADSVTTVRALIKRFGLLDELAQARRSEE